MYINDSREDKFRMEAYKEAIVEIKKLNIHEAINKLNGVAFYATSVEEVKEHLKKEGLL